MEVNVLKRHTFDKVYFTVTIALFLTVLFPVFQLGNKAFPIVFGLPFSFFWVVMWSVVTFTAVLILYVLDPDKRGE